MILIGEHLTGEYSLGELARRRGISRKTAYKWIRRYVESNAEGLKDLSRAAHPHPNAIQGEVEQAILDWKGPRG
jgi:putative transposase